MQDFKDKVAVITGGSSGVGRSLAFTLGGLGAKIVVGDVDQDAMAQLRTDAILVVLYMYCIASKILAMHGSTTRDTCLIQLRICGGNIWPLWGEAAISTLPLA